MTSQNESRRQLMLDKPLQTRIMISATRVPLLMLLIATVCVGMFCMRLASDVVASGVYLPSALWLILAVTVFLASATGFIVFHSLKLSNRIAGPMLRMGKIMKAFQSGQRQERVLLRPQDLLWPLAQDMNSFLEWVEKNMPQGAGAPDAGAAPKPEASEGELVGSAKAADQNS